MRYEELVEGLAHSGALLAACFARESEEAMRWKPAPAKWSLLEILGHLCDEEVGDFGRRLRLTIEEPKTDWPPIDPDGWVIERKHNEANPEELLDRFRTGRLASLEWLRGLSEADMASTHKHAKFGSMQAGDLLAAWCAHDLLHLAQIARTKLERVKVMGGPYSTGYAAP